MSLGKNDGYRGNNNSFAIDLQFLGLKKEENLTFDFLHRVYTDQQLLELCESQEWTGLEVNFIDEKFGNGVFATDQFRKDEILSDYPGIIVPWEEHLQLMDQLSQTDKVMQKKVDMYVLKYKDNLKKSTVEHF